jgi:hypothetical protein
MSRLVVLGALMMMPGSTVTWKVSEPTVTSTALPAWGRRWQDRPFGSLLVPGPANTARIAQQDLVIRGRHQDGSEKAVCLGR